ncbi:NAD(P)H-dependent oxidoreductase [Kitasatospora fiedleri]|uniref:NAD(P)H-dependent oxidoreductase n=1 Tax=Kitasatospora fiedleri TaxID=2991545 RepID=UPI00249C5F28|nr:NAD(P)H-dependent oxidoreductase [Kitasatospora fiedleri]
MDRHPPRRHRHPPQPGHRPAARRRLDARHPGRLHPRGPAHPEQREAAALGASLAEELRAADAAIIAVPLYNWGVSQHFKTWVDLVIAAAGPTTELLKDKPVLLVASFGGGFAAGTPREGWDHSTPYVERILRDVWGADLTTVRRELTMAAANPAMESLRDLAAEYHAQALDAAATAGKNLARA